MSGFSSTQLFTRRRTLLFFVVGALGATLLAGCGGGGGNGNTGGTGTNSGTNSGSNTGGVQGNASVIGKITDVQGNGIPGVSIIPDSGGTATTSLGQGGYRLDNLSGNAIHQITASVSQNGVQYTGSTQVLTQSGFLVSNANILVSPATVQATVSGSVTDTSGTALAGVRVYLAVPNNTNYSSLVAYTDSKGNYTLANVPVNTPTSTPITIAASTVGQQNKTFTLPSLQAGGGYNQNFTLAASTGTALTAPMVLDVTTATEPTDSQSGRLLAARAIASTSVYEKLRRLLSPAYARTADRTPAAGRRKIAQVLGQYAIETDLAFTPITTGSVFGYSVYRSSGATAPTEAKDNTGTPIFGYDFLQDPLANYFTDLTFSTNQSTTSANVQYNFALSATNTDNVETAISPVYSIIPLGPLTLNKPTPGASFANPVTVTWSAATGATKYYVFVYDQYPSINISPIYATSTQTPLAASISSQVLPTLTSGKDYYVVVVGAADQNEDLIAGQTTSTTPVVNAATTFSQITRFHVQ